MNSIEKKVKERLTTIEKKWNDHLAKKKPNGTYEWTLSLGNEPMMELLLPLVKQVLEDNDIETGCKNLLKKWNTDEFQDWKDLWGEKLWLKYFVDNWDNCETSELTPEQQEKLANCDDLIKEKDKLKTENQQSEEEKDKLKKEIEEQKEELIKVFEEIIGKEETEELTKKPVVEVINEVKAKVKGVIEIQEKTIETVESNNKLLETDVESQKNFVKSREDVIKQALGIESDIDLSEKEDWEKELIAKINSSKELITKINEIKDELASTKRKSEEIAKDKEEAVAKRGELHKEIRAQLDEETRIHSEYKEKIKNLSEQLVAKDKEKDLALAQRQEKISELESKITISDKDSLSYKKKIKKIALEKKSLEKKLNESEEKERVCSAKLKELLEAKEILEKEKEEKIRAMNEEYEKLLNDYKELVKKNNEKDTETISNLPAVRPNEEEKAKLKGFLQNFVNYLQSEARENEVFANEEEDEKEKQELENKARNHRERGQEVQAFIEQSVTKWA